MNSKLIRILALQALLGVCHLNVGAAEQKADPVGAEIQDRATQRFRAAKIDRIETRHLDGTRGYKVTATSTSYSKASPEQRQRTLRNIACNAVVFGVAKLESARSFVGRDGGGVFTRFHFRLLDDWRAMPERRVDPVVQLVMEGGEAKYQGETVRVENALADYQVGSSYLLAAGSRFNTTDNKVLYEQPPLIEVADDVLYPAPNSELFASGTSVSRAKAEIDAATPLGSCN